MKLSLMVMTKNGSWRLERMLRSVGDKAFEIIVGVDAATTDDTAERARRYTPHVYVIENPQGYIEPHIKTLFEKCGGDWVLRLDDDELMSTNFALAAIPAEILDGFDLIGFPRVWVVNRNPPFYIGTGPGPGELVPQYRLMKRSAYWSFRSEIHTPGFDMKPAHVVPDMFIYHLNLLDQSFEDRRSKYDFYQTQRDAPCNRTYLFDPAHLYRAGQSFPCCSAMFPPLSLLQSTETDFPTQPR